MIPALIAGAARVGSIVARVGATAARVGGQAAATGAKQGLETGARHAVYQMTMGALSHTQAGSRQVPPDEYDDRNRF
ncbi:hypothetical protein GCM10010149_88770 [Nonomuraea roseoviolacea subsp. roseoviolacea]|uniref:hypothetical protein n=1 Tax=Nonomuraea roseoviolacea TaxID=103837 RepID=UPI0031CDDE3A